MADRIDIVDGGRTGANPLHIEDTGFRSAPADERSITDLLRELSREAGNLVRGEAELARAEVREKVEVYRSNLAGIAIGGGLMLASLILIVEAVNRGLTALLESMVGLATAVWLAPLVLSFIIAGTGYALLKGAVGRIRAEGLKPRDSAASLADDVRWIERKVKS
jgi:hypothetical protein